MCQFHKLVSVVSKTFWDSSFSCWLVIRILMKITVCVSQFTIYAISMLFFVSCVDQNFQKRWYSSSFFPHCDRNAKENTVQVFKEVCKIVLSMRPQHINIIHAPILRYWLCTEYNNLVWKSFI